MPSPANSEIVNAQTDDLFRSMGGGLSWKRIHNFGSIAIGASDPNAPSRLLAGNGNNRVYINGIRVIAERKSVADYLKSQYKLWY